MTQEHKNSSMKVKQLHKDNGRKYALLKYKKNDNQKLDTLKFTKNQFRPI